MLTVSADIVSDPVDRDIDTIKLRPMLASQAPIVSRIMARWGINIILICVVIITINMEVRSIASRQNRARRRCEY